MHVGCENEVFIESITCSYEGSFHLDLSQSPVQNDLGNLRLLGKTANGPPRAGAIAIYWCHRAQGISRAPTTT